MKLKHILMSAALLAGSLTATAQETKTVYTYVPNWYVGAQIGGQHTVGEASFGDLLSPNAQIIVGRNFNSVVGLRLGVNAWQSKGGIEGNYTANKYDETSKAWTTENRSFADTYKWNYIAPNLDLTLDLTNLIGGFNPERKWSTGIYAGIGLNYAFNNDEANDFNTCITTTHKNWVGKKGQAMSHLWNDSQLGLQGRFGANVDYHINQKLALGLELSANVLNDHYNSKHAPNADWYFNALVGIKYTLGKTHTKQEVALPVREVRVEVPVVKEVIKEVIKEVEKPVGVNIKNVADHDAPMRIDVFFTISSTQIVKSESLKINEIVKYLNNHPAAKVEVSGYADKGTGRAEINQKLSEKRADIVTDALLKAGIPESRIVKAAYGDTVQPFEENDLNRVTICIAQ